MKISVALCTYNGAKYIDKQLASILSQTYSVHEVIICDDGSTDLTPEILEQYRIKFPGIVQVIQNPINLGSKKNFDKAISMCSNDLIFLSDQDDIWVKTKVEEYVDFLNKNPAVMVVASNGFIINDEGIIQPSLTLWDVPKILSEQNEDIDFFSHVCQCGNIVTGASIAIRQSYVSNVLPIPNALNMEHDEWITLVSSRENSFAMIDKKLFFYREHNDQQLGGVSFPLNEDSKSQLYNQFSLAKYNFSRYKWRIKQLAIRHNRLLTEPTTSQQDLIIKQVTGIFNDLLHEFLKSYPIRGHFTRLIDKLTNKRQIAKLANSPTLRTSCEKK
ncbi:glycosyltransferase [Sphingobacterium paludis]|jgi:glycosyltransferase involved in cell wall biosynthesis|uniref:Glycosyltransferase involved in cell wall biosynthesis n=1 Tax=Sphingobacterium paludis TaxID=1476465 RepID=A0A4R7CTP5_9SPHI|nr:glycosyltransferase [Sphingobacterium paludis]TDS11098.1 glycosyltransferase involved in cell wall biosynthesis [Sphingobacterium paludis]